MKRKKLGRWGEDKAAEFLKDKGYQIVARNYKRRVSRFLKSEIDIIAKRGEVLVFVEVKALKGDGFIAPDQHVTRAKIRKIAKTAQSFLIKKGISLNSPWQIDVVSLVKSGPGEPDITHLENVASDSG